jgi:hypothetical protein
MVNILCNLGDALCYKLPGKARCSGCIYTIPAAPSARLLTRKMSRDEAQQQQHILALFRVRPPPTFVLGGK